MKSDSKSANRRKFLLAAGATAATAVTAPAVQAQSGPINFRFQSTWPSKDIFHEYALDFGKRITDMTGGDLKIEVLPAGAVVPAFQLLDAVSKGVLDGGHGGGGGGTGRQHKAAAIGGFRVGFRHVVVPSLGLRGCAEPQPFGIH